MSVNPDCAGSRRRATASGPPPVSGADTKPPIAMVGWRTIPTVEALELFGCARADFDKYRRAAEAITIYMAVSAPLVVDQHATV